MREPASNREWIFWGSHDPLFAVATAAGREAGAESGWTPAEFFASGQRYFADVERQWAQYGMGARHCVEIGSGTGRITRQLAARFARVTAVDVAPGQLEGARRLLAREVDNVDFTLVSQPVLPLPDASADAVFSCEVFQHLDPALPLVQAYVTEAHRVLAPDGTLCFHAPVKGVHPASLLSSPARNGALRILRRLGRRRMMIYQYYSAPVVLAMLAEAGFVDVELRAFLAAEEGGHHTYFLGRRA